MSLPAEYRNRPGDRITVHPIRTWTPRIDVEDGLGNPIVALDAWTVWTTRDGRTDLHVVSTRFGKTVIDGRGRMVSCWHLGISAGDLARLTIRANEKRGTTVAA